MGRRTCDRTRNIDEISLAAHQVRGLFENEHGMGMRNAAFVEEMLFQELDVGTFATSVGIEDEEFIIDGYVSCGRGYLGCRVAIEL